MWQILKLSFFYNNYNFVLVVGFSFQGVAGDLQLHQKLAQRG